MIAWMEFPKWLLQPQGFMPVPAFVPEQFLQGKKYVSRKHQPFADAAKVDRTPRAQPVMVEGVRYPSVRAAAQALGISYRKVGRMISEC